MSGRRTLFAIGADDWPGASKVLEESGEVIQVLGKLMATYGDPGHWSGDLRAKLIEELGDLRAALDFFVEHADVPADEIEARRALKYATFVGWHRESQPGGRVVSGRETPRQRLKARLERNAAELARWPRWMRRAVSTVGVFDVPADGTRPEPGEGERDGE